MIDIFNVDKLLEALGETLNKLFSSEWLLNIINYTNEKINPKNLNLYVNNNITKTRGFHVDSYYRSIKAFIYLTDVNCLDDGPYCFVKGTHVDNPLKKLRKKKKSTGLATPDLLPLAVYTWVYFKMKFRLK